ncbi:MAG: GntR family transcriptional regulator [Gammaproteobacteria bacterium]|jgi:GntR family transcriptional regulator|nr:GntR family transcriptional regulator [Gammaproteobacteria bacterium]MDH3804011.1 GntR family transcriptional regulator [Gammaproteobacteria bacterium]
MPELLHSLKSDWQLAQHGAMLRVPLYHQLYSVLKAAILDGTIPHDAQMPTEQQLTETFDVSRITAKRAMDELAAEKLISRFRGKGSHVTYHYTPKPVRGPLVGMLESLIDMGEHSIVRVLSIEKVVPPVDIRERLNLSEGDYVHKVIRVSSNEEGEPYAYYVSWTVGISRAYTKRKLESTPRLNLLRENDISLTKMEQVLSAKNASGRIAAELDVEPGAALLSVRRFSSTESGVIVDVLEALYNPERYQFAMVMGID